MSKRSLFISSSLLALTVISSAFADSNNCTRLMPPEGSTGLSPVEVCIGKADGVDIQELRTCANKERKTCSEFQNDALMGDYATSDQVQILTAFQKLGIKQIHLDYATSSSMTNWSYGNEHMRTKKLAKAVPTCKFEGQLAGDPQMSNSNGIVNITPTENSSWVFAVSKDMGESDGGEVTSCGNVVHLQQVIAYAQTGTLSGTTPTSGEHGCAAKPFPLPQIYSLGDAIVGTPVVNVCQAE